MFNYLYHGFQAYRRWYCRRFAIGWYRRGLRKQSLYDSLDLGSCPCKYTTPCVSDCSCVNSYMSYGCDRCAAYGSKEQQQEMSRWLATKIDLKFPDGTDDFLYQLAESIREADLIGQEETADRLDLIANLIVSISFSNRVK